jgi:hypothetical protein
MCTCDIHTTSASLFRPLSYYFLGSLSLILMLPDSIWLQYIMRNMQLSLPGSIFSLLFLLLPKRFFLQFCILLSKSFSRESDHFT